ncbi:hypothetical protein [Iningainema tapete]|uniref:Uncharacterized protein n=1 Tax=Iningainema tapete BLCC-T55 TaxID=2748662 RepID=A0A8J6XCF1_9CYAN|nr:hypothetical protein [Iningainema tapete]MBD2772404.1 hypothetical protein [Iningainema tapete BLCC-T55]
MTRARLLLIIAALVIIALSWWGVVAAQTGLVLRNLEREGVPMVYVAPRDTQMLAATFPLAS